MTIAISILEHAVARKRDGLHSAEERLKLMPVTEHEHAILAHEVQSLTEDISEIERGINILGGCTSHSTEAAHV